MAIATYATATPMAIAGCSAGGLGAVGCPILRTAWPGITSLRTAWGGAAPDLDLAAITCFGWRSYWLYSARQRPPRWPVRPRSINIPNTFRPPTADPPPAEGPARRLPWPGRDS